MNILTPLRTATFLALVRAGKQYNAGGFAVSITNRGSMDTELRKTVHKMAKLNTELTEFIQELDKRISELEQHSWEVDDKINRLDARISRLGGRITDLTVDVKSHSHRSPFSGTPRGTNVN